MTSLMETAFLATFLAAKTSSMSSLTSLEAMIALLVSCFSSPAWLNSALSCYVEARTSSKNYRFALA